MKIKPHFTPVFQSLWEDQNRINAFRGGARSSKTWSILQAICIWFVTGYFGKKHYPKGSFSIVRETLPSLRASAYKDFIELLHEFGVYRMIDHRKTVLEFHFGGRSVVFFSTDDLNSAKLRGRQHSFAYINEANTVSFEAFNQISMRTEHFLIVDYNPAGYENWCKTHVEGLKLEQGKTRLHVSTYKMNPFLTAEMVEEIEALKYTDRDLYDVYARGNWVKSRNNVFESFEIINQMPKEFDREYFGIDFGYQDPTAVCRVLIHGNNIFIEQLVYKSKLMLNQLADKLHSLGVGKLYADHEPRTIRELKTRGIRIKPAKKGNDSIRQGLGFIRQHNIHILSTSKDAIREFSRYRYKLDDLNNPTDEVLDQDNHIPDAVRYAVSYALRRRIVLR